MVNSSLAHWLQLREAADAAARSGELTRLIAESLAGRDPIRVLDLATGTGANLRYLAPHLPGPQHWLVVDRDPELLALVRTLTASWAAGRANGVPLQIETRQQHLGSLIDTDLFAGRHLVTASALLDLVSERWLEQLVTHCRTERAAALFTISYNGESRCSPVEPEDDEIRDLLNQHQHRDKGLGGPAAGPGAASGAVRLFTAAGHRVLTACSDWSLGERESAMQRYLIEGWAGAATEMGCDAATIASWHARRLAHIDAGRSRIVVGHLDIAAVPPPR